MWIKIGVAAAVLTYAGVSLASVNYRELYNEMYPANGLKRGVLGLCQAAKPTFVRAVEQDRTDCYDSMPSAIERAIGWVRTSARRAALRSPTGVELAEKLMQRAEARPRPLGELLFAAASAALPAASSACERPLLPVAMTANELSTAEANDPRADEKLARRVAGGDQQLLAELGIGKVGAGRDSKLGSDLPVLSLGGVGPSGPQHAIGVSTSDLGDSGPAPLGATGCRTPA